MSFASVALPHGRASDTASESLGYFQSSAKRGLLNRSFKYLQLLLLVAVGRTRVSDGWSFEVDGPNAPPGIGFLEFLDLDELIGRNVLEDLLGSTSGPRHFDGSYRCGLANADVLHQR